MHGGTLVHHFDAVALQDGGHDTDLVERATDQARETTFVETLGGLLGDVDRLPSDALPGGARSSNAHRASHSCAYAATGGLLPRRRGMKMRGGNSTGITAWVMYITPQDHPLLPVSSGSGESHRRRRLLGVHSKHL